MPTPERRALRSTILWCSRWLLLGGNEQFRGKIRVQISSGDGSESVLIREESCLSERVPTAFRQHADAGMFEFLLRSFLSADERHIIRILAESPRKGSVLMDKSGVERSRFYTITACMVERGLICKTDDGYELASPLALRAVEVFERSEEAA